MGCIMVTLNPIFASDMIMQAKKPVRFFGCGHGTVAITLNGERRESVANGQWLTVTTIPLSKLSALDAYLTEF